MCKRFMAMVLLAVLLVTAAGCADHGQTRTAEPASETAPVTERQTEEETQPVLENPVVILGRDGSRIGAIDGRADMTAVDSGIFYRIFTMETGAFTGTAEYRFFSFEEQKDTFLGRFEDQGYEAFFGRTELNGVIYTLAVQGNPIDGSPDPLLLLAFDPAGKTVKSFTVSEDGFPYTSMTVSDGVLVIMNHELANGKTDKLYQFDPASETVREVLSFAADTDSLRGVCASGEELFLLRLKLNSGGENEMYVDRYDRNYRKVSEQSVNEMMTAAILNISGMQSRQDVQNEFGLYVSRFAVLDGRYLVYENFGLSRVIADLQSGETLLAKDDTYSVSDGTGRPVVYRLDFETDTASSQEIYGIEDGKLKQFSFQPEESHPMMAGISRSANGTWAVLTADAFPARNGSRVLQIWAGE